MWKTGPERLGGKGGRDTREGEEEEKEEEEEEEEAGLQGEWMLPGSEGETRVEGAAAVMRVRLAAVR